MKMDTIGLTELSIDDLTSNRETYSINDYHHLESAFTGRTDTTRGPEMASRISPTFDSSTSILPVQTLASVTVVCVSVWRYPLVYAVVKRQEKQTSTPYRRTSQTCSVFWGGTSTSPLRVGQLRVRYYRPSVAN